MKQQSVRHKKREHEALLYKLEVKINSNGNILFNYDWVKPEHILDNLKKYEKELNEINKIKTIN